MKTAIFSDTHFTTKFDKPRFRYLEKMIQKHDQVIINGDFWDGYNISFEDFLESDWRKLFPLLKKKRTVYVYGNHDPAIWQDERVSLFSDEAVQHYIYITPYKKHKLVITHGNQITDHKGDKLSEHRKALKVFKPYYKLRTSTERKLGKTFGWDKDKVNQTIFAKKDNKKILEFVNSDDWGDQILVMSHTHSPYFKPKRNYVNTGNVNFHLASYLRIEDNGELRMMKETF